MMARRDSIRSTVQSRRILAAVAVLAIVWVGVYWATPPAPQPAAAIIFDGQGGRAEERPIRTQPSESALTAAPPPAITFDPEPVVREPAVIPPAFRERVVRANETMESIAKTELGDTSLWTVVASANPRVDPLKLRPGMTIRIPIDPTNIQGKPNPALAPPSDAPAASSEPARIEYVVRSGDTLGGIARTYYNSASKWRIILDANSDVLSRPEQLRPGMKLVIPPAPVAD
jgi:nucleoid-associated protein YgaU